MRIEKNETNIFLFLLLVFLLDIITGCGGQNTSEINQSPAQLSVANAPSETVPAQQSNTQPSNNNSQTIAASSA